MENFTGAGPRMNTKIYQKMVISTWTLFVFHHSRAAEPLSSSNNISRLLCGASGVPHVMCASSVMSIHLSLTQSPSMARMVALRHLSSPLLRLFDLCSRSHWSGKCMYARGRLEKVKFPTQSDSRGCHSSSYSSLCFSYSLSTEIWLSICAFTFFCSIIWFISFVMFLAPYTSLWSHSLCSIRREKDTNRICDTQES